MALSPASLREARCALPVAPNPKFDKGVCLSIRWFIGIVGAVLIGAGLVFLNLPIKATDSAGTSFSCGTALQEDDAAVSKHEFNVQVERFRVGREVVTPSCETPRNARKMWAIPVSIAGVLAMLGAATVRRPSRPE